MMAVIGTQKENHLTNCRKLDTCHKIAIVLDKEFAFLEQYQECVKKVCEKCKEGK